MSTNTSASLSTASDRILVIDDDVELCALVSEYLAGEGFRTDCVHAGDLGLDRALRTEHALIVLDVMLPGLNGFEVLRRLRVGSRLPVLLLTARGEDVDRILGLELGADDYLPKPFNPRELVARIRAILRRTQTTSGAKPPLLQAGGIELDTATRTVRQDGMPVELTSVEFNLLEVLLRSAGQVVTRDQLAIAALGRKFAPFDRSIDMHVSKVRKKLGDTGGADDLIKTVRGSGYIFAATLEIARP
jgi:two-component system response regulator CpxR